MIIPIRCMSCGKVISDKWIRYQEELEQRRSATGLTGGERHTMDGTAIPKTIEYELLEKYGMKRWCCRKHFLTHVDLMSKI
jgi:DNA-directed RNA polymerase I, II, and III subunit RPABC5